MVAKIGERLGPDCLDLRNTDFNPKQSKQHSESLVKLLSARTAEQNTAVKKVYLNGTFLNSDDLTFISNQCPNVEVLNLKRAHRVDDAFLKVIGQSFGKTLLELNLGCARNDADLHQFDGYIWTIPRKNISAIKKCTDAGIIELLQQAPKLKKLELRYNTKITQALFPAILNSNMIYLGIKNCIRLGETQEDRHEAIDQLWKQCPWMAIKDDRKLHSHSKVMGYWKWIQLRVSAFFTKIFRIVSRALLLIQCRLDIYYALLRSMRPWHSSHAEGAAASGSGA